MGYGPLAHFKGPSSFWARINPEPCVNKVYFITGTGSDWSTEDLDFENEGETKMLEWDKEVERELALQVTQD